MKFFAIKNWINIFGFIILVLLISLFINLHLYNPKNISDLQAQIGTFYVHSDSSSCIVTSVDTTYSTVWTQLTIWSTDIDILLKIGAPDTTSWSDRKYLRIPVGQSITFGPATKVRRLEYRSQSGSGTIYFIGYKTVSQF